MKWLLVILYFAAGTDQALNGQIARFPTEELCRNSKALVLAMSDEQVEMWAECYESDRKVPEPKPPAPPKPPIQRGGNA